MKLAVQGIPSENARSLRAGGADANTQPALRRIAQGMMNPCRHCLQLIDDGDEMLVFSYRPFDQAQPYAETGPVFLHAAECQRYDSDRLPPWFAYMTPAVIRGYGSDDWIKYETGAVVPGGDLTATCHKILADPDVAYVHIRSKFNCFQCRVDRG